jgi:hypothetical protein
MECPRGNLHHKSMPEIDLRPFAAKLTMCWKGQLDRSLAERTDVAKLLQCHTHIKPCMHPGPKDSATMAFDPEAQ